MSGASQGGGENFSEDRVEFWTILCIVVGEELIAPQVSQVSHVRFFVGGDWKMEMYYVEFLPLSLSLSLFSFLIILFHSLFPSLSFAKYLLVF